MSAYTIPRMLLKQVHVPYNPFETRRVTYRFSQCDAMALALHDLTHYPLALAVRSIESINGESTTRAAFHAMILLPHGHDEWLDVDGIQYGIPKKLRNINSAGTLQIVPATFDEVNFAFKLHGVTEEAISLAKEFVMADPNLSAIIKTIQQRRDR